MVGELLNFTSEALDLLDPFDSSPSGPTTSCTGPSSIAAVTSRPWKYRTCWPATCARSSGRCADGPATAGQYADGPAETLRMIANYYRNQGVQPFGTASRMMT